MLTSNPSERAILNLNDEHSNIVLKLQEKQNLFNITLKKAVSGTEFKEFTQKEEPDILHFSGHGEGGEYAGLIFQNDDKNDIEPILLEGLGELFKYFKKRFKIKVVVLNACHTEKTSTNHLPIC